jgi:hypothetical protein
MVRDQEKSKRPRRSADRRKRSAEASHIAGLPPTDNLRRHPDEVYGDTEIPRRGRALDKMKSDSR